jgi:hypothetical protein
MIDNEKIQSILDALPEKQPRSRLEPYGQLLDELRRLGRTYREIERILHEECHVHAPRSTINDFVRRRARPKRNPRKLQQARLDNRNLFPTAGDEEKKASSAEPGPPAIDEVYRRIAILKQRPASVAKTAELFHYDPNEPLHLPKKAEPKEPGE